MGGATLHATPALDVYVFGGSESETAKPFTAGGKFFGYGNPNFVNSGCLAEAETGTSALACTGNIKSVDQITAGFWDKLYSGRFGYVRVGVQYSHTDLQAFPGENVALVPGSLAPKTSDDMISSQFQLPLLPLLVASLSSERPALRRGPFCICGAEARKSRGARNAPTRPAARDDQKA